MSSLPFILVLVAVGALLSMVVLRGPLARLTERLRGPGSTHGASRRRPDVPRVPPDEVEVLPPGRVRSPFGRRLVIIDVDGRRHST